MRKTNQAKQILSASHNESLPELSPQAVRHLEHLLDEYFTPQRNRYDGKIQKKTNEEGVLFEWLTLAATVKRRVPAHLIPSLLKVAAENINLRPSIADIINDSDILEAQQTFLSFSTWWAMDDNVIRHQIGLKYLRAQDAATARELFQAIWKATVEKGGYESGCFVSLQMDWYLPAFSVNLSDADEDFLNTCLTANCSEKAKKIALHLLAQLPNSAISQRHQQRLTQWLRFEKGGELKKDRVNDKLIVEMPETYDPAWLADGIEEHRTVVTGKTGFTNQPAWWFEQTLGFVSPSYWSEQLQLSPREAINLIKKHDWKDMFLHGLITAAEYHLHDEDWAEAFIGQNFYRGNSQTLFWRAFSPLRAEKVATRLLTINSIKNKTGVLDYLSRLTHQWSVEFSMLLINTLMNSEKYRPKRYQLYPWIDFANHLAPVADCIDLLADYQKTASDEYIVQGVDEMLAKLNFRRDMIAAFTNPTN